MLKLSSNKQWFVYNGKSIYIIQTANIGSQPAGLIKYLKTSNIAFQIELLEVSLVCSLLVFKPIRILISLGLFSFWFCHLFSCCSLILLWYKNEAVVLWFFFWKKNITYCSYYTMCYVIFPVDYPGRTSMFTEFELKQITYLQRSAP